jgi:hypothetical protein
MPDTGVADDCLLIQMSPLSANQKSLRYRSDRRPFGANFTLLPIVSSAVSECGAWNFGRLRRGREMQIPVAVRSWRRLKPADSMFSLEVWVARTDERSSIGTTKH